MTLQPEFGLRTPLFQMCSWKKSVSGTNNSGSVKQRTLSQTTSGQGFFGRAKAQLSAHHRGRQQAPVIVTYGAPLSVFQHLHSALAHNGPTAKTDQRLLGSKIETPRLEVQPHIYVVLLRSKMSESAKTVASARRERWGGRLGGFAFTERVISALLPLTVWTDQKYDRSLTDVRMSTWNTFSAPQQEH